MRTIIRDNYTPKTGDYHETYVIDEVNERYWTFDCDGVFRETSVLNEYGDSTLLAASQQLVTHVADGIDEKIGAERNERIAADEALEQEIQDIKNSPDVVDIVATYADLMAYNTSKLGDKDIIRVLTDETHDNGTSYYRWDKPNQQWVYIGSAEGYYTKDQTDVLLAGKQDKLTAGANITIDANNEISATDTTYNVMTGATAVADGASGLVPAPLTGDQNKVLKGDGTWGISALNTIFYANLSETGLTRRIYKDDTFTTYIQAQDIIDANNAGQVVLRMTTSVDPTAYSDAYLQNAFIMPHNSDYEFVFLDEKTRHNYSVSDATDNVFVYDASEVQPKLTAGSNISISGNTISATLPAGTVDDPDYVHTDNNFTTALKDKLDNIAPGAEVNVQSDWDQVDTTADDYIQNKPVVPVITMTATDPGEGVALQENHYIAVYSA